MSDLLGYDQQLLAVVDDDSACADEMGGRERNGRALFQAADHHQEPVAGVVKILPRRSAQVAECASFALDSWTTSRHACTNACTTGRRSSVRQPTASKLGERPRTGRHT